jgi:hypothetical protein
MYLLGRYELLDIRVKLGSVRITACRTRHWNERECGIGPVLRITSAAEGPEDRMRNTVGIVNEDLDHSDVPFGVFATWSLIAPAGAEPHAILARPSHPYTLPKQAAGQGRPAVPRAGAQGYTRTRM